MSHLSDSLSRDDSSSTTTASTISAATRNKKIALAAIACLCIIISFSFGFSSTSSISAFDSSSSPSSSSSDSEKTNNNNSSNDDAIHSENKQDDNVDYSLVPDSYSWIRSRLWEKHRPEIVNLLRKAAAGSGGDQKSTLPLSPGEFPTACPELQLYLAQWLEVRRLALKRKQNRRKRWVIVDVGATDNGYFISDVLRTFSLAAGGTGKQWSKQRLAAHLFTHARSLEQTRSVKSGVPILPPRERFRLCGACCDCATAAAALDANHNKRNKKKKKSKKKKIVTFRNVDIFSISPSDMHVDFVNKHFKDIVVASSSSSSSNNDEKKDDNSNDENGEDDEERKASSKKKKVKKQQKDDDDNNNNNDNEGEKKEKKDDVDNNEEEHEDEEEQDSHDFSLRTIKAFVGEKSVLASSSSLAAEYTCNIAGQCGPLATFPVLREIGGDGKKRNGKEGENDEEEKLLEKLRVTLSAIRLEEVFSQKIQVKIETKSLQLVLPSGTGSSSVAADDDNNNNQNSAADGVSSATFIDILRLSNPLKVPDYYRLVLSDEVKKKWFKSGRVGLFVFELSGGSSSSSSSLGDFIREFHDQYNYECYLPVQTAATGWWYKSEEGNEEDRNTNNNNQNSKRRRLVPISGSAWRDTYNILATQKDTTISIVCVQKNRGRFPDLQTAMNQFFMMENPSSSSSSSSSSEREQQQHLLPPPLPPALPYSKCGFSRVYKQFIQPKWKKQNWWWALVGV